MSDDNKEAGAETPPSWQDSFKIRADLKQRDFYAFEDAVYKLGAFSGGSNQIAGRALKAAIDAGWLEAPASEVLQTAGGDKRYHLNGEDVDDMHPAKVLILGGMVTGAYNRMRSTPPN